MSEQTEPHVRDEENSPIASSFSVQTPVTTASEVKRPHLWDRIMWLIMRIAFVTPTLEEVRTRKYNYPKTLPAHTITDSQAQFLFELAESSSDHTDDKIKQLLTLSSSLVAVLALFGGGRPPADFGCARGGYIVDLRPDMRNGARSSPMVRPRGIRCWRSP